MDNRFSSDTMGGPVFVWAYSLSLLVEVAIVPLKVGNQPSGTRFLIITLGGVRVVLIFVILAIHIGEIGAVCCPDPEGSPRGSERSISSSYGTFDRSTRSEACPDSRKSTIAISETVKVVSLRYLLKQGTGTTYLANR